MAQTSQDHVAYRAWPLLTKAGLTTCMNTRRQGKSPDEELACMLRHGVQIFTGQAHRGICCRIELATKNGQYCYTMGLLTRQFLASPGSTVQASLAKPSLCLAFRQSALHLSKVMSVAAVSSPRPPYSSWERPRAFARNELDAGTSHAGATV